MKGRTLFTLLLSLAVGVGTWYYLQAVPRRGGDDRPRSPLVVAARDLGAGSILQATDLTTIPMPTAELPPGAVADPAQLVGEVLANIRFAGEAITPAMLGARVPLAPHERGIAVRLTDVAGLAGLVSPGQVVGLMVTVTDEQSPTQDTVAKFLLSGLRVVWLSPEFRLRADAAEPTESRRPKEGLALLAVSTQPAPILYAPQTALFARALSLLPAAEQAAQGVTPELLAALDADSTVIWGVPLEMVAAVAAVEGRFQLVLEPAQPQDPGATPGFSTLHLVAPVIQLLEAGGGMLTVEDDAAEDPP